MLSSLLRPRKGRRRIDHSPFSSPFQSSPIPANNTAHDEDGHSEEGDARDDERAHTYDDNGQTYNEDDIDEDEEDEEDGPLLPIFSAAILDALPIYDITHSIRILIVQKCETTLSWDQLRAPQLSQFLVKPIQSQIRANHFNRATLCALIANCLQFKKEVEHQPGNAGVSTTRAMLAELLAMRLLKEFSTRELIDALSYDFNPLQGLASSTPGNNTPGLPDHARRGARISTVEIAIRATAKRFLAHPLVVQQLEAIWAGSIVFHSAADNLHRRPAKQAQYVKANGYGTIEQAGPRAGPANQVVSKKPVKEASVPEYAVTRRSVTLYDPRDASLFKLSRLRVPRYRQLFSTLSFASMLCLFLLVLVERSLTITPLEVVFWFWSAGYMLDEVVGFTEQGFGLYIMSVWNAFDLGILFLFIVYYVLRLYGILMPDVSKHQVANMAYDVLASTAVLLFPRAFSVLDHYRYFSQLLIAFRMMALDLVAILILIVISCSGFFVAFTLSFGNMDTKSGPDIAYALFQILMGFSPAAWNVWPEYNLLGKTIMTMFLIICHFLIVTILITVLTNSFMAIVQNANEEHQFLFAVNTISMVKSDALFSYIAPTNLLSWLVSPLRFIIPFRQFVKFNRTVIKVTHFPILAAIFGYERVILSRIVYSPTDLVDRSRINSKQVPAFSLSKNRELLSPSQRLREPSVVSFHKDRALDAVFSRPFRGSTMRTTARDMQADRPPSENVVDHWMQNVGEEGGASPPMEQPRSVLERLETRRPTFRRHLTADRLTTKRRDFSRGTRSVASEPEDRSSLYPRRPMRIEEEILPDISLDALPQETDADGDDELLTNDEGDLATIEQRSSRAPGASSRSHSDVEHSANKENIPVPDLLNDDTLVTPTANKMFPFPASVSHATRARLLDSPALSPTALDTQIRPTRHHDRTVSSNTVVLQPKPAPQQGSSTTSEQRPNQKTSRPHTARHTNSGGAATPTPSAALASAARRIVKPPPSRIRPAMPPRAAQHTTPNIHFGNFQFDEHRRQRQPSFNAMALDLASDLGDNRYTAAVDVGGISGMPASFSEQVLRERELARDREQRREQERQRTQDEEKSRVGRIMLARMNTLEEGFREVLGVMRDLKQEAISRRGSDAGSGGVGHGSSNFSANVRERGNRSSLISVQAQETRDQGPAEDTQAGPSRPKTPIARMNSERSKKSPRKIQRRSKGKDVQKPEDAPAQGSPDSNRSPTAGQTGDNGNVSPPIDRQE